ncbi:probable WRKY transcription factor 46 [Arachis duranensis]|uniref:Probable WRKY transcription factor 46 n=1 Tax=Arachis duranensis TaxID=130453 RepID=A0A6P4BHY8_ARADU|nr:probable WRKY transcription factor 46 [Arachis duranensis]
MEQVSIVGELMQGKELAKKLFDHLNSPSPSLSSSSSHESNEALIEKILSTYEKVLTMLSNTNFMKDSSHCSSSSLANGSTKSEVLDKEDVAKHKQVSKKRKTMSMWTKQVRVCLGTELDGSMEDGYSWRKYGQKDILGAKFPRGYFRCTHRHVQGCLATKQVQKSDEDPNVLEITYKGRHTCIQVSHHSKNPTISKPNMALLLEEQPKNHQPTQKEMKTEQPTHETILTFGTSQELEVKLDDFDFDFDPDTKENIFSSLCFTSPSIVSENDEDNNKMFSYIESFSPEFISPTTNSESNNIFHFNDGLGLCVQTSDSDFSDNVSAPTSSVSNSSIEGLDFHSFDEKVDFDNYYSINS